MFNFFFTKQEYFRPQTILTTEGKEMQVLAKVKTLYTPTFNTLYTLVGIALVSGSMLYYLWTRV